MSGAATSEGAAQGERCRSRPERRWQAAALLSIPLTGVMLSLAEWPRPAAALAAAWLGGWYWMSSLAEDRVFAAAVTLLMASPFLLTAAGALLLA